MELTSEAAADPVFEGAPSSFPALQWHADTFDLPHGATRLGPGTLDRLVDEVAAKEDERSRWGAGCSAAGSSA